LVKKKKENNGKMARFGTHDLKVKE